MGEICLKYPLSTTGGIPYRFRSIWRTQDSTWELYKCYLRKTTYSIHQPSSAIDFMISYGGTRSERLTDDFGSTRNTYWEYWGISPHNIELRKQSITTSFYSLALSIFRRDCYFDSHVTFTARLSISEFKLHKTWLDQVPVHFVLKQSNSYQNARSENVPQTSKSSTQLYLVKYWI